MKKRTGFIIVMCAAALAVSACSPKVGSERWCKNMADKDKGEWTANEAAEYAKNCVFK